MGSFKYPRELTWVVGMILLICTLGMAFTGQVLRWDQDAYWGVGVGAAMTGRVPVLGPILVRVLFGGPNIGGATLTHFFALHVFLVISMLVTALVAHLYLVLRLGISEPPAADRPVDPQTYLPWYQSLLKRQSSQFFPDEFMKDAVFSGAVILAVLLIAWLAGPKGPTGAPDPTLIHAQPRPDWPFLPIFALLALSPRWLEAILMLGLPPAIFLVLFLVPFVTNRGQRAPSRRPVAVLAVILGYVTAGALLAKGIESPWSPQMDAWSADAVPVDIVRRLRPLELEGAAVFQNKTCRNCHVLGQTGGLRGPDLTDVAARLDANELIRQVIQGGGLMPSFGKQLQPAEVDALVAFLRRLHSLNEPPRKQRLHEGAD
jgi:ubiquinol-cytochrome c reductase cytochrome b subunit